MKILKSQIEASGLSDFAVAAQAYSHEVKSWKAHMQRVKDDEGKERPQPPNINDFVSMNGGEQVIDQASFDAARIAYENSLANFHQPYPAPLAHPLVQSVLDENDEPDFEIEDDGPTPEQVLAGKKNELRGRLGLAEQETINAIVPAGKRRSYAYRENDIRQKDAAVAEKFQKNILKRAASAMGIIDDINTEVTKARSSEDAQHLADQEDRRQKIAAIERRAAEVNHSIEDLTLDTIDKWQMPELK